MQCVIEGVEVVAGADKAQKNRKYAERFHVKTYDDYTKLIDSEDLDAVIISLPNFLKKEGVFYAAEKGLDIFLDKPIARNLAEAQEMVAKGRERKCSNDGWSKLPLFPLRPETQKQR